MAASVINQIGIDPTQNIWLFYVQGDPSVLGLAAGLNSVAIRVPVTGETQPYVAHYVKTGAGDTAWTNVSGAPGV